MLKDKTAIVGIGEKTPFFPLNLEQLSLFDSDNILNNEKKGFDYVNILPKKITGAANGANTSAVFAGINPNNGQRYVYLETLGGGMGGRYSKDGKLNAFPPSSIPFLALGSWILTVGWFGFNVMSAQTLDGITGLVAVNSLMAMVGGTLAALVVGKNDPGFLYNGPLAGLVAVCAGSNLFHPLGALATGAIAGGLFVWTFALTQNKWKIDDVLGVWPLHGICGAWGGIAAGIFGLSQFGGLGGVTFLSQLVGTVSGVAVAFFGGYIIYSIVKNVMGIRLTEEEEFNSADITIHKINSVSSEK